MPQKTMLLTAILTPEAFKAVKAPKGANYALRALASVIGKDYRELVVSDLDTVTRSAMLRQPGFAAPGLRNLNRVLSQHGIAAISDPPT